MVVGEHQEEGSETEGGGAESRAVVALYLYGDVLESVVECLPAADLAATAVVSSEWLRAVRSVLRRRPRRLPWLVVHLVGRRRQTAAYDPHSGSWLSVHAPSLQGMPSTTLRHVISGRGDRLCALSLSGLDIAGGVLGTSSLCSRALKAPSVWRVDPVLAVVGELVVAVGGASEFAVAEGENGAGAGAVEVHEGGKWSACDPMPSELRESASSATWLSAAATDERLYVMDRTTGWASWFNPSKRCWGPTRRLRPEPDVSVSTWGIAAAAHGDGDAGAERLVLFGASKQRRQGLLQGGVVVVVQAWEVDGDALDLSSPNNGKCDAMPSEMSGMLFPRNQEDDDDETACWPSIRVCGNATGGGYVYNAAQPANGAVLYELLRQDRQEGDDSRRRRRLIVGRWERVPCAPSSSVHAEPLGRVILACSPLGLDELPGGLRPLGLSQLASSQQH